MIILISSCIYCLNKIFIFIIKVFLIDGDFYIKLLIFDKFKIVYFCVILCLDG